ncbi:MAG: hypothetical protein H7201_14880 [Candidatus Saccharibacteria bacterium]|nr:hypothetical protein [Microbacteriaceae bacterium]
MANSRSASTRTIGIALILLGVCAALGVVAFTWLAATYGGLHYKCIVEGPRRDSAPFALVSEEARVHGYFSWWPLGRTCDWERADGQGFVPAGPGWTNTILFVGCVVIAIVGAIRLTVNDTTARPGANSVNQDSKRRR